MSSDVGELCGRLISLEHDLKTLTRELNEDKEDLRRSMEKNKEKDELYKEKMSTKLDEIILAQTKHVGFTSGVAALTTLLVTIAGLIVAAVSGKIFS